jgi:hypothetical protein
MSTTPFNLGGYFNGPNTGDPNAKAAFEAELNSFTQLMGTTPQFIDSYVNESKPIGDWVSDASWQAWTTSQFSAVKGAAPVIGLPLTSSGNAGMSADQQYKAFASGAYDGAIQGMVQAWAAQGFTTQYWRPGWEMNVPSMPSYAGADSQTQADWVSAFQHISGVLHQAGQANGVNTQVVWSPSATNYDTLGVLKSLYPGNGSVDIIGADVYADMYPYNPFYDWGKNDGTIDGSLQQWMADPANRLHYWTYPAATPSALDGSGGHNMSLQTMLDFAKAQGKPFAIPETGAGSSNGGHDVADEAAFPGWLAQTLAASGANIAFVNLWDANAGGNFDFSSASANKPGEAAAWAKSFGSAAASPAASAAPSASAPGSQPDTVTVNVSEDAWQGDARFIVSVDGKQAGDVNTVTALHAAGQGQDFTFHDFWGAGAHNVAVNFLNDAYGGAPQTDRNLYVNSVTLNGHANAEAVPLLSGGTQSFAVS